MEDQNQQNPNTQQPQPYTGPAHEKVIQPSAELVQEVRAAQEAQPAIVPQPTQVAPPTAVTATTPPQPVAPQSIYPQPTSGVGYASPQTPTAANASAAEQPSSRPNGSRIMMVRVVAGVLILLNIINLYDWYLQEHAGYTNIVNLIEIGITVVLLIGIAMLKEIARMLYVVIAGVLLLISAVGIIRVYTQKATTTQSSVSSSTSTQLLRTSLERSIALAKENPHPTQDQKNAEQATQRELNNLSTTSGVASKSKQYLSDGLLIVVAVGPLIFLTRPSIKTLFS